MIEQVISNAQQQHLLFDSMQSTEIVHFSNDGRICKIQSVALLVTVSRSPPAAASKDESSQVLGWGAG